ncbi:hypothetical protein MY1884_008771 [Beauveria asiatica]
MFRVLTPKYSSASASIYRHALPPSYEVVPELTSRTIIFVIN